jgi:predicted transcriptional regulator
MPNPLLSVRLSPELNDLLQQKESETGMSRSSLTIAALEAFLKPPSPEDELARLKMRVEALERQLSLVISP